MQPHEVGAGEILANLSLGTIILIAFVLTAVRVALAPSRSPAARSVAELVESLLIAGVLVFLIIRPFFLQAFYIPSESMEPTLMGHEEGYDEATHQNYAQAIHDRIFVNKLAYRLGSPRVGDVVVFRAPKEADSNDKNAGLPQVENVLIKRVVGLPGDTIEVKQDPQGVMRVYRNGKPEGTPGGLPVCNDQKSNEPCFEKMDVPQSPGAMFAVSGPLKLDPNQYFVMGDNRNYSNDSRFWGPLDRDRIIGKAMFIFWPPGRIRILR